MDMAPFGDILANLKGKGKRGAGESGSGETVEASEARAAEILADAERESAEIRAGAEAECRAVAERYNNEASETYWTLVAAGRLAADQKAEQMVNLATMEVKKQVLAFRQTLMEQTFDLALRRLADLPEGRYVDLLASLSLKAVRTGREQIIFSARDRGVYGKQVTIRVNEALRASRKEAALTMSEETRDMLGGVIVTDGQVETNCSLEALAAHARRTLTGPVAEILFE